jgi:hypothetical protein
MRLARKQYRLFQFTTGESPYLEYSHRSCQVTLRFKKLHDNLDAVIAKAQEKALLR